jgi:hypothetical protein
MPVTLPPGWRTLDEANFHRIGAGIEDHRDGCA